MAVGRKASKQNSRRNRREKLCAWPGQTTWFLAFHLSFSSRFQSLTFHLSLSEFQLTFTAKLPCLEPSVPLLLDYSQSCIVCGTSKSSSSRHQRNIFFETKAFSRRSWYLLRLSSAFIPASCSASRSRKGFSTYRFYCSKTKRPPVAAMRFPRV